MTESTGAPPPAPAPQKTNPWIIVIAILVLVCCLCVGLVGLLIAFGDPILHELGLTATRWPILPIVL